MRKLLAVVLSRVLFSGLAALCPAAGAQVLAPAPNPMPDGSDDMYAGLGVASAPRYAGAAARRRRLLPVLQAQWSNGMFISGMSAGLHLSHRPWLEYGPLLALHPGRDGGGDGASAIGAGIARVEARHDPAAASAPVAGDAGQPLRGLPAIARRWQGGAFVNLTLAPHLRLISNALYGAGADRHGATLTLGMQAMALAPAPHHGVTLGVDLALVNRNLNQAYFGIDSDQSARSGAAPYDAHGGWRDARAGASWHWAMSPAWLLVSHLDLTRQLGATRFSPLVTRSTGASVSTALAYRF